MIQGGDTYESFKKHIHFCCNNNVYTINTNCKSKCL